LDEKPGEIASIMDKSTALSRLANHLAQGEFKQTIELSTELIDKNPEFARAYGFRGLANFEIVIRDMAQVINDITVKSLNLKASEKDADRTQPIKNIISDWEKVYSRMSSFTEDLRKALVLDEEIFLDFDKKSTETFKRHWNEGIGEFLKGTIEIVAKYDATSVETSRKKLERLKTNLLELFKKLENPPTHLHVPEDYLGQNSGNAAGDKDVQAVDFGETIIDFDIASIARSGILAKSQHIVAYTMNSAIQSKEPKQENISRKKPIKSKPVDISDKIVGKKPLTEKTPTKTAKTPSKIVKTKRSERTPKTSIKKPVKTARVTKQKPVNTVKSTKSLEKMSKTDAVANKTQKKPLKSVGTSKDSRTKKSRPEKPKAFSDSQNDGFVTLDFSESATVSTGTLTDSSLRKVINYRGDEALGKTHKLVRDVRFYFDKYCKNTEGHTYPNLNDFIKPANLTRRFLYIFEFHFLYQKRRLSWQKKVFEGEEPRGMKFNPKTVDKWEYSHDRFSYRNGNFNKPVDESFTFINCENCGGEGRFSCTQCNGIGRVKCNLCDGMGAYPPEADKLTSPCPECGGSGGVSCPACHNEGFINCKTCDGRGQVLRFLNLEIVQDNRIKSQVYPAEFYPRDSQLSELKKRYTDIVLAEEYKGLPDISDMQKILPDELTGPVLKMFAKMEPEKAGNENTRLYATAIKVYEVEILRFEYFAKIREEGSADKRFSADFVLEDFKIYPSNDPHLNLVHGLQNKLETSLKKHKVRESRRIINNLSTIIGKHDVLEYAKTRIVKKAKRDNRLSVFPASIIALILLFFMPDFTEVSTALKSWHVFIVPVFVLTFFLSLILRSMLKTICGRFLSRFIFLTIMSIIVCGSVVYGISQQNPLLLENFVSFVKSHIYR
ncbi:MAG: hypothetical protein K8S87_07590, partial [Planctomycetes bacterium]|nr:hypothetical protein [Planctomycetota bacterium]